MNQSLFTRIVRDLSANCPYFQEGCDAVGKVGISALVFTRIVRDLSANCPYFQEGCDAVGKVGISALVKCTLYMAKEYYAKALQTDVKKLYAFHQNKHGFPGTIGSINCTKWLWAQCLQAYRAQFSRGDSGSEPFILLEAVASQDLWIWHAFFGVAGLNNDVNVLSQSPILNDLKVGKASEVPSGGTTS
ncbi:ALP1-like protein isoform X1 [Tanacetum coccineum]